MQCVLRPPSTAGMASRLCSVQRAVRGAPCSTGHALRMCSTAARTSHGSTVRVLGNDYETDSWTNITPRILDKVGRNLHHNPDHPLGIIKRRIEQYFTEHGEVPYNFLDSYSPVVTTHMNFDSLLIPTDHVSRGPNDTYYLNKDKLLRTHTSAHQAQTMAKHDNFLVSGDVYRRDEIDASHYPVFHQMEGVHLFGEEDLHRMGLGIGEGILEEGEQTLEKQARHTAGAARLLEVHLKKTLEGMVRHLFGNVEIRWVEAYFPFTHPSLEVEIFFNGEWLEVLGCGVIQQNVIPAEGRDNKVGWAFGLGLERLAMILFQISDIRLFWSDDERFLSQFSGTSTQPMTFKPFSKHPPCYKDISFWINSDQFTDNNFFEVVRSEAGDIAECVNMVDDFVHPKTNRRSKCFRITFRSMDRTVTNEEVNGMQERIRQRIHDELDVELR